MRAALLVLLAATSAAPAAAHEVKAGDMVIEHPLLRASLGRVPNTAGYLVVRNKGRTADRLLGAACACAAKVELHAHEVRNGVSSMRPTGAVLVPGGGEAAFAPGGRHLMITGLKRPLEAGTTVNLTLRFERAGAVSAPFFVTGRVEEEFARYRQGGHHAH